MYSRRKSVKLALVRFGIIYFTLIVACAPLADAKILSMRNGKVLSDEETRQFLSAVVPRALNEIYCVTPILTTRNRKIVEDTKAKILRSAYSQSGRSDPITARFRRDEEAAVTQNAGSSKDYMSTYYARRKAIMDKYNSQQKEIRERLKKAKSQIAASKKRLESKKIEMDLNSSTQAPTTETSLPNITDSTTEKIAFDPTTSVYDPTIVPALDSTTFIPFFDSIEDETADYDSSESDSVTSTTPLPLVYETLRPPVASDYTNATEGPKVEPPREENWQSETDNLSPQNEVDFNLTEHNLVRKERDNDTLIIDLGGQLTNPSVKNESVRAFEQLEEMFFWDEPRDDERISDVNETGARTRVEDNSRAGNGNNSDNASQSSDSLRFTVEIKSSPEILVTKNIKNFQTSTTTFRNSTHEVIDVDGVANSTKKTNGVTPESYLPSLKNINFTYPTVIEPSAVGVGGGATEEEWCEECPHDYRWGDCDGTLFYVHNAFLRNKGPSAIDAVFGMNVDGPISITCVEALRYNQTRGIVTLHSGGPGHDFAKIRIRGFQGEGFSYIMKVWGVGNG